MPENSPTWLRQRRRGDGAVLLADWPGGPMVLVECTPCGRTGRYALARLVERYGPAAGMPDVLDAITADCPRHRRARFFDQPCRARFMRPRAAVPGSRPHPEMEEER